MTRHGLRLCVISDGRVLNRHGNAMGANAGNTAHGMRKKVLTMAEYIEREAAIRVVNGQSSLTMTRSSLIDSISKLSAADVAPVVHGQWEPGNPICPVCGGNKFKDLDADIWCDWQPDFCPNCGAKMDGDDSDER